MKYLILLFILFVNLFAASVDTKLYEGENRASYYDEVKKEIQKSTHEKLKDSKIIQEEFLQLSRVREASEQKISIESYNLDVFDAQSINLTHYYNGVKQFALVKDKKNSSMQISKDLQSKLLFLKKTIENITESERSKLLSYQLQFAYYKLQQKNVETKLALLDKEMQRIKTKLIGAVSLVVCNEEKFSAERFSAFEDAIEKNDQEIIAKELEKEKALIEGNQLSSKVLQEMDILKAKKQELKSEKISLNLMRSVCLLEQKKSTNFYKLIEKVQDTILSLDESSKKSLYLLELEFIKDISKERLGQAKFLFGATLQESKDIFSSIKEFIFSPLFVFNEQAISISSLLKALLYVVFGFLLGIFYKRWIFKIMNKWKDVSMMSVRLISNIGYYLIVLIFIIISIGSLGIDMSSLSLIAGALSIGIGFGLQTVVSNLIAGIILMFERTIRIGDIIEINNELSGTVTDMRIRSTTIQTFDNIDIVVPNSSFIQNNVINMTLEDRTRRLHIPFSVSYGTEIADVKRVVLEALSVSDILYIRDNEDRKAEVRMTLMNSSSVDLELIVWVNRDPKIKNNPIPSDFMILIYDALRANDINIPFPQLDVYMKEDDTKKREENG